MSLPLWLGPLVGVIVGLLGAVWGALTNKRSKEAEARHKAELDLQRRDAEAYKRGMEVADERRQRTEVVVDVYRKEADRLRREAAARVEVDGDAALRSGDPGAPGRFLRDVMRADSDGDRPDPDARPADPDRGATAEGVAGAGHPAPRGRR